MSFSSWNTPAVRADSAKRKDHELLRVFGWFWTTGGLKNLDFLPLPFPFFLLSHRHEYRHMLYAHIALFTLRTHTHTHLPYTHMLLLVIHVCMSISSFSCKKLTAVPQKSKQFAQGYLDRPSIHSWELEAPGGFIMRRLLILGFPLENLDEFHFI